MFANLQRETQMTVAKESWRGKCRVVFLEERSIAEGKMIRTTQGGNTGFKQLMDIIPAQRLNCKKNVKHHPSQSTHANPLILAQNCTPINYL